VGISWSTVPEAKISQAAAQHALIQFGFPFRVLGSGRVRTRIKNVIVISAVQVRGALIDRVCDEIF